MHCTKCGSSSIIRKGIAPTITDQNRYRYNCKQCGSNFYVSMQVTIQQEITEEQSGLFTCFDSEYQSEYDQTVDVKQYSSVDEDESDDPIDYEEFPTSFIRDDAYVNSLKSKTRLVITSAQNNSELVDGFLDSIKTFCAHNDAGLIVIPLQYKKPGIQDSFSYAPEIVPYLIDNKIVFRNHRIAICADLKLTPTAINPLSGIDGFSKGNTVIVGHPQVQLKTLPRNMDHKYPPIVSTTGSITKENYSRSKAGIQAEHNHSYSALLLEFTENEYFIRHLNYDDNHKGFYDLDKWYDSGDVYEGVEIDALITGDTHVRFHDKEVYQATFGLGGIIDVLKPKHWVIHDLLDFATKSHHTIKDPMANLGKRKRRTDIVEDELQEAMYFLTNNLPTGTKAVVVGSNHDMHLDQWLRYGDIKVDPENAKIYHYLWFLSCKFIDDNETDYAPPAFGLYFWDNFKHLKEKVVFLDERDTFKLHGIELSIHGANGTNGARGSINQYSKLPDKTVTGHSHSPSIMKGAYCVGTSSVFDMPYVRGASSWDHAHCIIHPNGKRQMIFLRNGKFKA